MIFRIPFVALKANYLAHTPSCVAPDVSPNAIAMEKLIVAVLTSFGLPGSCFSFL